MEVKGKIVLVTGASRGIGAATAKLLAQKGAILALVARSEQDLGAIVQEIHASGGKAHAFPADLSDAGATGAMAVKVQTELGHPQIIINNAGAGRWLFTEETPIGEEDQMIALPYLAAFRVTRLFLPAMLEKHDGMILNVNSPVAVMAWSGATGYAASRWALRGFTQALRADLAGTGVRVSQVILGETESNYFEANPGSRKRLPAISKLLPVLQPDAAAKHILRAIQGNRKEYTAPFLLLLTRWMLALFPGIVKAVVRAGDIPHPASKAH